MLAIKFEFKANRYHATQWGRHVNEGAPEWPPSPWRLLRGMVATWRRTLPDLPDDRVVPILEALASEYPKFHLPPASTGHTRHYMPYNEGTRERTTLVIDSFVAVRPGKPLFAVWPKLELDSEQLADLGAILRNMPYFGRAESWVEASLASDCPEMNSMPLEDGALPEGDWEIARTLMPRCPVKLEDLERETSELRRSGRIDPEGSAVVAVCAQAGLFHRVSFGESAGTRAERHSNCRSLRHGRQSETHGVRRPALGGVGAEVGYGSVRQK